MKTHCTRKNIYIYTRIHKNFIQDVCQQPERYLSSEMEKFGPKRIGGEATNYLDNAK